LPERFLAKGRTAARPAASQHAMKFILALSLALLFALPAAAQEKPLTQQEYVRMLYALEARTGDRAEVLDALRVRGIAFTVTDGLRSLTRSKSRNDLELRRALDEAERRRQNPSAAKRPNVAEADAILNETRSNTLQAVDQMPDFVVKQLIQRSAGFAGTGSFRNLDRLVVGVSYRASGEEEYRVLSVNGAVQADQSPKRTYEEVGGTSSTGEFVTVLALIFKPESETRFELVDTDELRGRRAVVFDFEIDVEKARQQIRATGATTQSTVTGVRGRMWIDRELKRVLRIESDAVGIPKDFPITAARRVIDYDWTVIADEKYLLPLVSDVRLTIREGSRNYETRNLIRFREYQKFGTEVIIRDEDEEPYVEDKPADQ